MRRRRTPGLGLVATTSWMVAMVLHARFAWADGGRVVVVDPDPRVFDAIDVALSPWNLRAYRAPGPVPQGDVGAASTAAGAIAESEHAGAVIWVSPPSSGPASLWVYEAETEQLVVRPLTGVAPFDEAGAAAVALSVKTILRSSPLVEPNPPPSQASTAEPRPVVATPASPAPVVPTKAASERSVAHDETFVAHAGVTAAAQLTGVWRLEAVVGARTPTGAASPAEPQAGLGLSVWPTKLRGHFGAGAVVQAGPGTTIENAAFNGQFTQAEFLVTARARAGVGVLAFELQAGPSLRVTSLDGATIQTGASKHAVQLNPAFDACGVVDLALGAHAALGAFVDLSALFRYQSYALDNVAFFKEPRVDLLFGARLSVELD